MNLSMLAVLVNEVSNGLGIGRISCKPETHITSAGNHSIGVFRNFSLRGRSDTGYSMLELSESEAAEKAVRNSKFFKGGMR